MKYYHELKDNAQVPPEPVPAKKPELDARNAAKQEVKPPQPSPQRRRNLAAMKNEAMVPEHPQPTGHAPELENTPAHEQKLKNQDIKQNPQHKSRFPAPGQAM